MPIPKQYEPLFDKIYTLLRDQIPDARAHKLASEVVMRVHGEKGGKVQAPDILIEPLPNGIKITLREKDNALARNRLDDYIVRYRREDPSTWRLDLMSAGNGRYVYLAARETKSRSATPEQLLKTIDKLPESVQKSLLARMKQRAQRPT